MYAFKPSLNIKAVSTDEPRAFMFRTCRVRTAQRIKGWGTTIKWSHTHDDRIGEMTRSPEQKGEIAPSERKPGTDLVCSQVQR